MPIGSTADLLFRIGANSDDAEDNISRFRTLLSKDQLLRAVISATVCVSVARRSKYENAPAMEATEWGVIRSETPSRDDSARSPAPVDRAPIRFRPLRDPIRRLDQRPNISVTESKTLQTVRVGSGLRYMVGH